MYHIMKQVPIHRKVGSKPTLHQEHSWARYGQRAQIYVGLPDVDFSVSFLII